MTDYVKMTGKVYWAKVYEPDVAFGASNFKIDFFPETEEDWEKFKKSGIQKGVKENENGKYFQLVTPSYKMIKGDIVNFTGPIVTDADGGVIVDYVNSETNARVRSYTNSEKSKVTRRGNPISIGNGTKVEVTVVVFDTFKGKGHRLQEIKILELVEYRKGDKTPEELPPLSKQFQDVAQEEINTKSIKAPW